MDESMVREQLTCNINETGVCALHNVEIERRKGESAAIDKSIRSLEATVAGLDDVVKKLAKAFYGFLGTTLLIAMIIAASFVYSRDIGDRSIERDSVLTSNQKILTQQVSDIAINTARNEGMQSALIGELREFTKAMRKRDYDKTQEAGGDDNSRY